ncbi:MAG: sigma-70 family RNA polymerase sigma factor [Actinobacteria bacterium]|nr:sigma-70 family RNA polymerase sigma factor [Actinomycetota bacterium]
MTFEREERLTELFRAHVAPVRGFVRTLVVDSDVDDIVSATFRTAWSRLEDIPQASKRAWLFGVARNHVLNHVRAQRRRVVLIDAIMASRPNEGSALFANGLDPVDLAPLLQALRKLTDNERQILELAAWYEMGAAEIAEVLGIEPNAARVRLHRARHRLGQIAAAMSDAEEVASG